MGERFQHQCHEIQIVYQLFKTSQGVTPIHHLIGRAKSHSERCGIAFLLERRHSYNCGTVHWSRWRKVPLNFERLYEFLITKKAKVSRGFAKLIADYVCPVWNVHKELPIYDLNDMIFTCHCLANIGYIPNDFDTFCGTESEFYFILLTSKGWK